MPKSLPPPWSASLLRQHRRITVISCAATDRARERLPRTATRLPRSPPAPHLFSGSGAEHNISPARVIIIPCRSTCPLSAPQPCLIKGLGRTAPRGTMHHMLPSACPAAISSSASPTLTTVDDALGTSQSLFLRAHRRAWAVSELAPMAGRGERDTIAPPTDAAAAVQAQSQSQSQS